MCRLYGLRASHPTLPSCELVDAQNSLLAQSIRDERGESNPHGWGIVERLADGSLDWEREAEPANEDDDYRREVIETPSLATIAHIRRATVGEPKLQNTHPFVATTQRSRTTDTSAHSIVCGRGFSRKCRPNGDPGSKGRPTANTSSHS